MEFKTRNEMRQTRRKLAIGNILLKWRTVVICVILVSVFMLYRTRGYTRQLPKSYNYFGGWQESDLCNISTRTSRYFIKSLSSQGVKFKFFIHDPKIDTVSKLINDANSLEDITYANLAKSFLDVFTDIEYVIDIGAHVGTMTVLSALKGKNVISIEGERDSMQLMCLTLSYLGLHKNVFIVNEIAGMSYTPVTWLRQTNGNYSGSYVDTDDVAWTKCKDEPNWAIEGRPPIMVDNLLGLLPVISSKNVFIIIDVNGYEDMVLLGAQLVMKKTNVRGVLINFKHHKNKQSGNDIVAKLERIKLQPYKYKDGTLINLDAVPIWEWPDVIMWI